MADLLELTRYSIEEFPVAAWEFLLEGEAEDNLVIGLIDRLRVDPTHYGGGHYLGVVTSGPDVVAVSIRTIPLNLVVSRVTDPDAFRSIASDAHAVFGTIPGVRLHASSGTRFLAAWREVSGEPGRLGIEERTMMADSVSVPDTEGVLLRAAREDLDLLADWYEAFTREALPAGMVQLDHRKLLELRIEDPHIGPFLWMVDGRPVSLAAAGGMTPNGIRIGPVYTPPESRNQGYASAISAALTAKMLRSHRFCFLETDAANPTSNRIYERMGYRFVCDHATYLFDH